MDLMLGKDVNVDCNDFDAKRHHVKNSLHTRYILQKSQLLCRRLP